MKFQKLKTLINEEWVIFKRNHNMTVGLYKNESLSDLAPDVRGLIDKDGNFWTADHPGILHSDLINLVLKVAWMEKIMRDKNVLLVERFENTNRFYFSESYSMSEVKNNVIYKPLITKFKKKNLTKEIVPNVITFAKNDRFNNENNLPGEKDYR